MNRLELLDDKISNEDEQGNAIHSNQGKITLYIGKGGQSYARNIGKVMWNDPEKLFIYWKKEKEQDRFRKTNAWSICWWVLSNLDDRDKILFETEEALYGILVKKAKENGDFLWFKSQGVEEKLYVPIKHWAVKKK